MDNLSFSSNGELIITPAPGSNNNDFDFFLGKWIIHNRKLKSRLNNSTEWETFDASGEMHKILNGMGNTDNFTVPGKSFEGMTLRLFNPGTRLWSIYWADNNKGVLDPPVVGSFEQKTGTFYAKDTWQGKDIVVKFKWDARNPDKPEWSQAFSANKGKT